MDRRTIQEVKRAAHGRVQHLECSEALPSQNCAAAARANFQSPQPLRQLRPCSAYVDQPVVRDWLAVAQLNAWQEGKGRRMEVSKRKEEFLVFEKEYGSVMYMGEVAKRD